MVVSFPAPRLIPNKEIASAIIAGRRMSKRLASTVIIASFVLHCAA